MYQSVRNHKLRQSSILQNPDRILQDESLLESQQYIQNDQKTPIVMIQSAKLPKKSKLLTYFSQDESKIFQSLPPSSQSTNPLGFLSIINSQIFNRMQTLDGLKQQFYENQQKNFLKTFINIMDRMSNQLIQYNQLYRNIDEQIKAQQECIKMKERKQFFQNQCLFLRQQYLKVQEQRSQVQQRSKILNQQIQKLKQKYRQGKLKNFKYQRANSRAKSCKIGLKSTKDQDDQVNFSSQKNRIHRRRANSYHTKYYNSIL